jgi:hypothetical protein
MIARGLGVHGGLIAGGLGGRTYTLAQPPPVDLPLQEIYASFGAYFADRKTKKRLKRKEKVLDVRAILHDDDEVLLD